MVRVRVLAFLFTLGVVLGGIIVVAGLPSAVAPGSQSAPVALPPPMGFGTWASPPCGDLLNEDTLRTTAQSMAERDLPELGYQYVSVSSCWAQPQRNPEGHLVAEPGRFPSGIKALADFVHDRGLKLAISAVADPASCEPPHPPSSVGSEVKDAAQFAEWGVDLVTYGSCGADDMAAESHDRSMRDALNATGRPMSFVACDCFPTDRPELRLGIGGGVNAGVQYGTQDTGWPTSSAMNLPTDEAGQTGRWRGNQLMTSPCDGTSATSCRSEFSLRSILGGPLMFGVDLHNLPIDTMAIISNTDAIAINQEPLDTHALRVQSVGGLHIISRLLSNGDAAVAAFNSDAVETSADVNLGQVGFDSGRPVVKDIWNRTTYQMAGSKLHLTVPPHSSVMYRVGPVAPLQASTWYLSGLVELSSSNGWGPMESDRSNGDQAIGDGTPLTIRGTRFRPGLGTHAPSEAEYYLGGTCTKFSATVGVDDDVKGRGSVVFQVYADDALIADSGLMTGTMPARSLSADVTRASKLRLVVTNGGDNIEFDHADWADAAVECSK
jgi:alpha-galactosidase